MPSKMKTCGDYREALTDAAAGGAEPSLELRSHLDACGSCRAAFTEEQQLFAAMDTGLRVSANAEVPASLLPRVRAGLNEQPNPRHWAPFGAAVATAVVLVAVIIFVRGLGNGPHGVNRDVNSLAHDEPRVVIQAASPDIAPVERASSKTAKHESLRPIRNRRVAQAAELMVLIPEGQKRAIVAMLASVRQGEAKANLLLAERAEGSTKELEVPVLVISPIELKPLADVSAESPSDEGKTKR
jgi:hypothetical protein